MIFPSDLSYTKNHEWIRVEGNVGTIGITDYAQDQLSDVVFLEYLLDEGESVSQGDSCAVVESVKAASDIYLPVSGRITTFNDDLLDKPEVINTDPYGDAWMIKVEMNNPDELSGLFDSEAYEAYCQENDQ